MPLQLNDIPILSPDATAKAQAVLGAIRSSKGIQLIGHHRPDGDCIGSLIALRELASSFGVPAAMAAADHVYEGYRLIPGYGEIETAPRTGFDSDLVVFSDCADRKRAFPEWDAGRNVVVIDHHSSNDGFGSINWIEPGCAATAEMVFYLWLLSGAAIPRDAANAMLLGIMTDTGSLRFSNVRPVHFEICAALLRAGADVTLVSKAAWETRPADSVRLGAAVLAGVRFDCRGALAWAEVRQAQLAGAGGMEKLPENLVNDIRSIDGVRAAVLITEIASGGVRASLRGDGSVNVAAIAGEFGGGGHPNAAGLTLEAGPYEAVRDKVLRAVAAGLAQSGPRP